MASHLPQDLFEKIFDQLEPGSEKSVCKGGVYLHYLTQSATDYPMHLVRLKKPVHTLHNMVWPVKFIYGLPEKFVNHKVNANESIENWSVLRTKIICGSCEEKDNGILLDLQCIYV